MRFAKVASVAICAASLALRLGASASPAAERRPHLASAEPRHPRSARVKANDAALFQAPSSAAPRRGSALKGALLPVFDAQPGPGCTQAWWQVGAEAWLCSDLAAGSRALSPIPSSNQTAYPTGLPHDYYFVGNDGALGYTRFSSAEEGAPDAQLEPGFVVALTQQANRYPGDPFGLTTKGLWIPMRDLRPANPSRLRGRLIESDPAIAWIHQEATPTFDRPGGRADRSATPDRFTSLHVASRTTKNGVHWLQTDGGLWLRERDVRTLTPAPLPSGLRPEERWIDIDLAQQLLTAYRGDTPIFTTLVSSGRGPPESPQATPKGRFRIWVKLRTSDMTNLENERASRYYAIEEVPWVLFFHEGYGIHGAFWHRSFGTVRSHGCVNLSPIDAQWLFHWASPRLPAGWSAVLPTVHDPGTLVQVR